MIRKWLWLVPISTAVALLPDGALQQFLSITAPTSRGTWWVVTVLLAAGFAAGGFRLMRALGVEGALLPVALIIAAAGAGGPLTARGADGPSGAGYGMEPLALCLLLWCYDAFARGQAVRAGVLLGAAGIAHPVVFAHGLFVLAVATPFLEDRRWQRLGRTAVLALAVGAPAALQLAIGAVDLVRMDAVEGRRLVAEGYRFRFPGRFTFQGVTGAASLNRLLLVSAGAVGAGAMLRALRPPAARAVLGLLTGHALLVVAAMLCYTTRLPGPWSRSVAAHTFDLMLTAPLLPMLAGIALLAALEGRVLRTAGGTVSPLPLDLALWASALTLLIFVRWSAWTALAIALAMLALVGLRAARAVPLAAAGLAAAALLSAAASYRTQVRPVSVDREDEELYRWARATPKRSLFIVPPSASAFRYYTRKGVVVDYDLIPPANPNGLRAWRDRIGAVARLEDYVQSYPAWRRPYALDRSYAIANTPTRAAELLREFDVQYLVWDARGLAIPPFLPVLRPSDPAVTEVFRNGRYVVYALSQPDSVQR